MSTKYSGTPEGEMINLLASINRTLSNLPITKTAKIEPKKGSSTAEAKALQAEMNKVIKPLASTAESVSEKLKNLRQSAVGLNRTVGVSSRRFVSLNTEMKRFLDIMSKSKISPDDFNSSIFSAATDVGDSLSDIKKTVLSLNRSIDKTNTKFLDLSSGITTFLDDLKLAKISEFKNDDSFSSGFNTNDVVHAIVDTKHVIQNFIKAYTDTSSRHTNSIIDAINKMYVAQASLNHTADTTNSILQQSNQIAQQAASTKPVVTEQSVVPAVPDQKTDTKSNVTATPSQPTTTPGLAEATNGVVNAAGAAEGAIAANSATTNKWTNVLRGHVAEYYATKATEFKSLNSAIKAVDMLTVAIKAATTQFFALAEMGMGSVGNMYELNVAAFKAGMSVKDYTEMFVKNMEFAARAGSIANFNAITSANDGMLRELGVFGQSARELQVAIAQTATEIGISQSEIPDTATKMIKVFERLNKTVSMTSREFMESIITVRESNQFQNEAAGLQQSERQARLLELTETYNFGRTLGLSADAANKLGKAMLDQRKMTVKDRFKESGKLMQLAAFTGNSAMIPEIQQLMLKGRGRSEEDNKRLAEIMGQLEIDSQSMYENAAQTRQLGIQQGLENIREGLSADTITTMEQVAKGKTADKSAPKAQDAFGQHVGQFGVFVGRLAELLQGVRNNEILSPLVTGVVAAFGALFSQRLFTAISNSSRPKTGGELPLYDRPRAPLGLRLKNKFDDIVTGVQESAERIKGGFKKLTAASTGETGRFGSILESAAKSLKSGFAFTQNALTNGATFVKDGASVVGSKIKSGGTLLLDAMKSLPSGVSRAAGYGSKIISASGGLLSNSLKIVAGSVKSIPLIGQLIAVGMELFTGDLRDAFSPTGSFMNTIFSSIVNIPYSIADFFVSGLEFVFGENIMKPIRTVLDSIASGVMYGLNTVVASIAKGVSWITDFLPEDSKLKKMVDGWKDTTAKVAEENKSTLDRTLKGDTLAKISTENREKVKPATAQPEQESKPSITRQQDKARADDVTKDDKPKEDPMLNVLTSILQVLTDIRDRNTLLNTYNSDSKQQSSFNDGLGQDFGQSAQSLRRMLGYQ